MGFGVGVALAGLGFDDRSLVGLVLVLSLSWSSLFFFYDQQKILAVLALFSLGLAMGLFWFDWNQTPVIDLVDFCQTEASGKLTCEGMVVSDPDRRDLTTRLIVALEKKETDGHPRVLVLTDNFVDYAYGDQLRIIGRWQEPGNFLTETGKVFDYQNYLAIRGVTWLTYYPRLDILTRGGGSSVKAGLFKIKNGFLANLRRALPEPAAALAGGLILGDKGGLGDKTETEFRQAGLSHLVVLSGYNITIVAENVLRFSVWFWPGLSWLFGLGAILLFVLMTGGEATVVRAAIMGSIALLARRSGRHYEAGVALVLAGFLMIVWQPRLLVFDLGFQLSFLATLGLIYLSPWVARQLAKRIRGLAGLREIVSTTVAAQVAVYPWLLYQTGNATLVGFVSNLFVLPIIPLAMLFSFLTGLSGFIFDQLALGVAYPTFFLLKYVLVVAQLFASLL